MYKAGCNLDTLGALTNLDEVTNETSQTLQEPESALPAVFDTSSPTAVEQPKSINPNDPVLPPLSNTASDSSLDVLAPVATNSPIPPISNPTAPITNVVPPVGWSADKGINAFYDDDPYERDPYTAHYVPKNINEEAKNKEVEIANETDATESDFKSAKQLTVDIIKTFAANTEGTAFNVSPGDLEKILEIVVLPADGDLAEVIHYLHQLNLLVVGIVDSKLLKRWSDGLTIDDVNVGLITEIKFEIIETVFSETENIQGFVDTYAASLPKHVSFTLGMLDTRLGIDYRYNSRSFNLSNMRGYREVLNSVRRSYPSHSITSWSATTSRVKVYTTPKFGIKSFAKTASRLSLGLGTTFSAIGYSDDVAAILSSNMPMWKQRLAIFNETIETEVDIIGAVLIAESSLIASAPTLGQSMLYGGTAIVGLDILTDGIQGGAKYIWGLDYK